MSLDLARQKFFKIAGDERTGAITSAGRALLNAQAPNDFEYYLMGFEVVNGANKVTDRFVLPVLPENITINNTKIINIKKTAAGISSYQNNSFEPISITMGGTFGRRFRLTLENFQSVDKATPKPFTLKVKTGYGLAKELERIYKKNGQLDNENNNIPFRINFYNFAFNQSYIVEFNNLQFTQSQDKNVLWYYNLTMTAVAPADLGGNNTNFNKAVKVDIVNKTIDSLARDARNLVGSQVSII
ncbi:hypothetical protein N8508_00100 [bacterium]|nr:hypothetical protein [bacterium]